MGPDPRSNPRPVILLALAVFYLVVYLHEAACLSECQCALVGRIAPKLRGAVSLPPSNSTIEMISIPLGPLFAGVDWSVLYCIGLSVHRVLSAIVLHRN